MLDNGLAVIGGGNMGGALLRGILAKGILSPAQVTVADVDEQLLKKLAADLGVTVTNDAANAVSGVDAILLAVKPQVLSKVLASLKAVIQPHQLILSIIAGVTSSAIREQLGTSNPVVRAMPNIAATLQESASALTGPAPATAEHMDIARTLFGAAGAVAEVAEAQMDAVTGLSGSGPAFVFTFIEALVDGGVRMGLPRAVAHTLAVQTVRGAAEMVHQSGEHPGVLRDRVTTPGGTTIAGLHALESHAFRATVIDAVTAATERSEELGKPH